MKPFSDFYQVVENTELGPLFLPLRNEIEFNFSPENHGDVKVWQDLLARLPKIRYSELNLDQPAVQIGSPSDCDNGERALLSEILLGFKPWRKGPFSIFGISLDAEWRSDWKWDRLKDAILPLAGRTVLDVGCGNGYYCLRMLGAGAKQVVGIDPTLLYNMQFKALNSFIGTSKVHVLPLTLEDLPGKFPVFDTVFSMGVLYHRKSPREHLRQLHGLIRQKGELVLETLIVEGESEIVLEPNGRYAKMRNVWQIPSIKMLKSWLGSSGFESIKLVDISRTTLGEQRCTDWMQFESLENFLDPSDNRKTIEGLPAPVRAILVARKP